MHRTASTLSALALVAGLAVAAPTPAGATEIKPRPLSGPARPTEHSTTYTVTKACKYEDGSDAVLCVWDASRAGNRKGRALVNVDYGDGWAYIAKPARPVSKRYPLRVTIHTKGDQPYSMRVVQRKAGKGGRDVLLARNSVIRY